MRVREKSIFERCGRDTNSVHRSLLKLTLDRCMNAQRYIGTRASLSGRNLLPGKFIGGAVQLSSLTDPAFKHGSLSFQKIARNLAACGPKWGFGSYEFNLAPDRTDS